MSEQLQKLAERIDALPLRSRVMVFCGLAVVLVFIGNAMLLEPLRGKERRLTAEITQQQNDMVNIRELLQRQAHANRLDPDAVNRSRRTAALEELQRLNGRVVEEQRRFTPPEHMRRLLEELLEKNRSLSLVDLKTLAPVAVAGQKAGVPGGMYRHGIELTVRGTYGELYDYLRALENLPNQLYWGHAVLAVDAHPFLTLKLTVHTLSFDRAWLIV